MTNQTSSTEVDWTPAQYLAAYHFHRFTAGWRQLLVFYMAMALAGYALVIHSYIFYATWAALVLMYWEPYLSPPFPWISDTRIKDSFYALLSLRLNSAAVTAEQLQELKQYILAIQRGLDETQLRVYKVLFGAIIVPYTLLLVGVVKQATTPPYAEERQAVYASFLLLAIMTVYTASVGVCLWVIHCIQQQESEESRAQEVPWRPHDMLFFLCKILGETLNTVVMTLVAGSFTVFMPWQVFWLCMCVTGLSYTATNLLYDFESEAPVQDDWEPYDCCGLVKSSTKQEQQPVVEQQQQQQRNAPSAGQVVVRDDSAQLPKVPPASDILTGPSPHQACEFNTDTGPLSDLQPPRMGQCQGVDPEACTSAKAAAATCDTAAAAAAALPIGQSLQLRGPKKEQKQKRPTPPFLKYKWPKGVRGKAIVWLLLAVAVPSVLLLLLVSRGVAGGEDTLFLSDPKSECRLASGSCLDRYIQLLVILGCLGCLISYYAFTIGFLGAGPVTWLFRVCSRKSTGPL